MGKFGKYFLILIAVIIVAFVFSYYPYDKYDKDRRDMIKVSTEFLETVKQNDTAKVKSKLFYSIEDRASEIFAWNVKQASDIINKYGLPKPEKISLDSSVHNDPTTIAVVFPLYLASNSEDHLQKAEIKVCLQKINGKYHVVTFFNYFDYKMTPIKLIE